MKKYFFGLMAIVFAVGLVAFTTPTAPAKEDLTNFYFKFIGVRDSEENLAAKWEQVTALQYGPLTCDGDNNGCKLIATSTQTIDGQVRPAAVYVNGSGDPILGTHVSEVKNFD